MKKAHLDAFCPNCEWTGDAEGITNCPVCNAELSSLDSFDEDEALTDDKDKYPAEFLGKIQENDDDYMQ
jgi:hypothetical protein